jgi:hypothetical protein
MSASKGAKFRATQRFVVGREVVVVGGASGEHLVDEIGQPDLALVVQLVLLVLRVGAALGLDLHIEVPEAGFQVLRRPALHRRPIGRHPREHQRAAAANIALHELALETFLRFSTRV